MHYQGGDGTAGDTLQDSNVILSDLDALSDVSSIAVSGTDASVIPLTLKAAGSQTANILDIQDSDANTLSYIGDDGIIYAPNPATSTGAGFSIGDY